MGYYTTFEIYASRKDGSDLPHETIQKIDEAIENLDLSDFCNNGGGSYWAYDKWYYSTEDMLDISHSFPDVLFTVYGNGEGTEDLWVEYFLAGLCQHEAGRIVYGEYDERKLGFDGRYKPADGTLCDQMDGEAPDNAPDVSLDEILNL